MESEFLSQPPANGDKGSNVSDGCEEILMPPTSITNGASDVDMTAIEYLEENDLDEDPMEDIAAQLAKAHNNEHENVEYIDELVEENEEEVEEEEEVVEEEEEAGEEEEEVPVERKPTQVPKKRRDAATLAAAAVEETPITEGNSEAVVVPTEEQPTSSARGVANKDSVDEEQCRVCTTKEDLVSLFKMVEQQSVAEMLMIICPTVSIARKDFMPQYICNTCMDNVTIAVQLKMQCETTERELRKKLSRSKNKLRRPTGYVVIDAPVESDPPTEEEANDDVEFKVSEASVSPDDDSDDSDFGSRRKRPTRGAATRRGRRRYVVTPPTPKPKEKKRMGRSATKRPAASATAKSSDEDNEQLSDIKKKRQAVQAEKDTNDKPIEYPCDECEQIFTRKLSLVLHKKSHVGGREPISCEICGKQFKIQGAYRTHLEKHRDDSQGHTCELCEKMYASKADLRRHIAEEHSEQGVVHQCNKCRRTFVSAARLTRHKEGRCPGYEAKQKRNDFEGFAVGKDLFKSVAPLTTTYWSDSFSD